MSGELPTIPGETIGQYRKRIGLDPWQLVDVDQERILRGAHRLIKDVRKYKHDPLWHFVAEVCAVGSTRAMAICEELGWRPSDPVRLALPPRKERQRASAGRDGAATEKAAQCTCAEWDERHLRNCPVHDKGESDG